jgi:hypothetical protein
MVFGRDGFDRKVILTLQTLHPSSQLYTEDNLKNEIYILSNNPFIA